jgi:tetraacyldisaccharide 4'-kinase
VTASRPWLLPLVPVYWVGVNVKNFLYDSGWLKPRSLQQPVISVGSLSAGGAGKTPAVIMLAKLLEMHGRQVDVLSRGYGRTNQAPAQVRFDYFASAAEFGDEPVEMMRAGLHVFVAAERYAAGVLAEHADAASLHLLDDGFQHRRLRRDLDIVLLTVADVRNRLLPAGNLREPLASLRRADVVVLRDEEADALRGVVARHGEAEVWVIRRELMFAEEIARPFCFCGIARPEGFLAMLKDAGHEPVGTLLFADHHAYREADVERIVAAAKAAEADGFYITEKDAVKLSKQWLQWMQTVGPVHAPMLRVSLADTHAAMTRIERVLNRE